MVDASRENEGRRIHRRNRGLRLLRASGDVSGIIWIRAVRVPLTAAKKSSKISNFYSFTLVSSSPFSFFLSVFCLDNRNSCGAYIKALWRCCWDSSNSKWCAPESGPFKSSFLASAVKRWIKASKGPRPKPFLSSSLPLGKYQRGTSSSVGTFLDCGFPGCWRPYWEKTIRHVVLSSTVSKCSYQLT